MEPQIFYAKKAGEVDIGCLYLNYIADGAL